MSLIKTTMSSRFTQGVVMEVDFAQIEVCLQAELAVCPNLINDIQTKDLHCVAGCLGTSWEYKDLLHAYNKGDTVAKAVRFQGKRKRFLVQYGGGAKALSKLTGCSLSEAQAFIREYYARYPEVKQWQDELLAEYENSAVSTGMYTHKGQPAKLGKHTGIFGLDYALYEEDSPWRSHPTFSPTKIKNRPVQGTAAVFMHTALAITLEALMLMRDMYDDPEIIILPTNTIYDSIIFDCSNMKAAKLFTEIIEPMLTTGLKDFIKTVFGVNLILNYNVDIEVGDDWNTLKNIHSIK
jgi:DNA polymerase I-like protein with 3'-5' exonuclease and polymerase domains